MRQNSKIHWWYTEIGEAEKSQVLSAFDRKCFSLGRFTQEFEDRFARILGARYAVATTSGTAAITMALLAAGIEPGDEVIIPDLSWIATANATAILGTKVVLVDCLPDLPLIDPHEVKQKITPHTKAIIPVHLNGRSCRMDKLLEVADGANITLIEDACKALASNTPQGYLGTLGDMGCFSLGMISLVSTGYGGVVVTSDKSLRHKLILIRNQGVPKTGHEKYETMSFNFKISDILTAIGIGQLSRLSEKLDHVHKVYQRYVDGLSSLSYIQVIAVDVASGEVPLCAEVRSGYREEIIAYLDEHGVEALRFHLPLHRAPYLRNTGDFPNASRFAREGFILPCGPSQPMENVDRCLELLYEYGNSMGR